MFTAKSFQLKAISAIALLSGAFAAQAVIIAGGTGTGNTTAPTGVNAWYNTGYVPFGAADSGGTGIYLGNRWVLTANHVTGGVTTSFTYVIPEINHTFNSLAGSTVTASNANGWVDLSLFRLTEDPAQFSANITPRVFFGKTPALGSSITVIGEGRNRASSSTQWRIANTSDPTNSTWTQVGSNGNVSGFYYGQVNGANFAKRWGTNVTSYVTGTSVTYDYNNTNLFASKFDNGAGSNEMQLASGDSGGPVFVGGRLVGLNLYTGDWVNPNNSSLGQPADTAVFGNMSYYANLPQYVDWIAGTTKVHPSWDGDANFDGVVDNADFNILYANMGTGSKWSQGDFNLDGKVDYKDYTIFQSNYGRSDATGSATPDLAPTLDPGVNSVPEPGIPLLLTGAVGLLLRRRR